jgi:hypothetical protein
MNINIKLLNIIPDNIEKYVVSKILFNNFGKILDSDLIIIQKKILKRYNKSINKHIIGSIKSTYMKESIMKHHHRLFKYSNYILNNYKLNNILILSKKFNLSPMTIIRFVLEKSYGKKLKQLIDNNLLESYDKTQYEIASQNDIYANLDQINVSIESLRFEKLIEDYLIKNNIKYYTQEDLTIEQTKKYGHAINTPDFLIKSDLTINNHKINWIDAKNFYGSNNKFIISKINKQIIKYINKYGSGCIIFNHGFNSKLKFSDVLILDYQSLIEKN